MEQQHEPGFKQFSSVDELRATDKEWINLATTLLRWFYKVSGIVDQLPQEFPSPEGQCLMQIGNCANRAKATKFYFLAMLTGAWIYAVGQNWETQPRQY